MSLTARLIITLTAGAVVLWIVTALATGAALRARLDEAFDGGLKETAERLLPLAMEGFQESDEAHDGHEVPLFDPSGDEYIVYQVLRADGSVQLRSHDAPVEPLAASLTPGFSTNGNWRVYTIGTQAGDTYIEVAEAHRHREDSLLGSMVTLLLPIGLLVPLSALGIFVAVRGGLRPLRTLSDEVGRRYASNLKPIATTGYPAELTPIAEAVQALIARLSAALEAERAFAANSAHELRTPIAGSLAQTQRLIAELEGHPARARAQQIEETLRRLRQLAEKLLEVSRADAGIATAGEPTDLLPALRLMVGDALRHAGNSDRIALSIAPEAALVAGLDVDAFGIVMRNLLDNALLHGEPGKLIEVRVPQSGVVEVVNAGPIVPGETLAVLTRRFVRGGTNAGGSGLGLAIVQTIMAQVGGTLELSSPAPGRTDGFCARIVLPLEPAEGRAPH